MLAAQVAHSPTRPQPPHAGGGCACGGDGGWHQDGRGCQVLWKQRGVLPVLQIPIAVTGWHHPQARGGGVLLCGVCTAHITSAHITSHRPPTYVVHRRYGQALPHHACLYVCHPQPPASPRGSVGDEPSRSGSMVRSGSLEPPVVSREGSSNGAGAAYRTASLGSSPPADAQNLAVKMHKGLRLGSPASPASPASPTSPKSPVEVRSS